MPFRERMHTVPALTFADVQPRSTHGLKMLMPKCPRPSQERTGNKQGISKNRLTSQDRLGCLPKGNRQHCLAGQG